MHKKQKYAVCLLAVLVICLFAGYAGFLYFSNYPAEARAAGKITAILNKEQSQFWKKTWEGLREEAAARHFDLSEYQVTNTESIVDYLEIAILTDTDGIIFNPSNVHDEATKELLREASDKGICLIALDTNYEDVPVIFLGIDNVSSGEKIAEYIHQQITDEQILLLSYEVNHSSALVIRLEAIQQALEALGYQDQIRVLKIPNNTSELTGVEIREYLNDYLPSVEGNAFIVGIGPLQTLYAAKTVLSLNASEQFRVVGYGESQKAAELLADNAIEALLMQNNKQMGSISVRYLDDFLSGEASSPLTVYIDSSLYFSESQ